MSEVTAVVSESHLIFPGSVTAPGSCRVPSPMGIFPPLSDAPPPCLLSCKIASAIGSIAVVNYLVLALFVSRKDLWGERILPGDFHLVRECRLTPSPPPRPHLSTALSTYILSHLRPLMPFLPLLLPLSQTQVEVNGEDV